MRNWLQRSGKRMFFLILHLIISSFHCNLQNKPTLTQRMWLYQTSVATKGLIPGVGGSIQKYWYYRFILCVLTIDHIVSRVNTYKGIFFFNSAILFLCLIISSQSNCIWHDFILFYLASYLCRAMCCNILHVEDQDFLYLHNFNILWLTKDGTIWGRAKGHKGSRAS